MTVGDVRGQPPRYTVERLLGRGGMASVYLAWDEKDGRRVALKAPADALVDDQVFRARFLRESRLAAKLVHPNVVRVYGASEDDRGLFIVMEYVEGETLADELARRGRLPADEVVQLGIDVSAALEAAHSAGLVHRDVKPHNIMRAEDGRTMLGDFGVARSHDSTVVTEHGTVLGTAAYLAPEQARGEQVTAAADLYSLGVVLYEALTGRLPHEGESVPELLLRRERDAPTPVRAFAPEVPRELEDGITQCLARRPDDRPASAAALGSLLAGPLTEAPTRQLAGARPSRLSRRRALAVTAAVLLAGLALGLGIAARSGDTAAEPTVSPPAPVSAPPAVVAVQPPAVQPPPPAVQPEPLPSTCADKDGGKGHRGKGKAKGHERQKHRREDCED
jgi:eukaryotic-like serine/threonine-protein kinase